MSDSTNSTTMTLDNSDFLAGMEKARESMAKLNEAMRSIGESLSGLAGQFVMPAMNAFTEGIKDAMEQGRQFVDQAKLASQSVATMVELKQAFESAGVSGDSVTGALFSLNKALSGVNENGKPATDAFAKLGLSIGDLKKMNGVEQFQAIIKGLQGLPDAAGRAAAAQQIFGNKAREIMGVLNDPKGFNTAIQGSAGYAKSMQENAGSFEKVGQAAEEFQTTIKQCYTEVAGGLAPALQAMFELVKKINLPEAGADLGRGIAFAFEAFKEGKVFEMIRLNLTIVFKEAVNTLYAGLLGAGAAAGVVFEHLPKLLSDAFSMLTNAKFWDGVGKLLLGAFKGIQGELTKIFFNLADALGNRLADLLDKIPMLQDIAEKLRSAMNSGNDAVQKITDKTTADAKNTTDAGVAEVTGASKPVVGDVTDLAQKARGAAENKMQGPVFFDITNNQSKLTKVEMGVATGAVKAQQANSKETSPPPGKNTPSPTAPGPGVAPAGKDKDKDKDKKKVEQKTAPLDHFKAPDADRFAKLGLFIGGAPQTPGLSEARRTAKATEESCKILKQVLLKTDHGTIVHAVYG